MCKPRTERLGGAGSDPWRTCGNSQHCIGFRRCRPAGATPGLHCENYWLEIILQKLQSAFIFKSLDFHSPSKATLY